MATLKKRLDFRYEVAHENNVISALRSLKLLLHASNDSVLRSARLPSRNQGNDNEHIMVGLMDCRYCDALFFLYGDI